MQLHCKTFHVGSWFTAEFVVMYLMVRRFSGANEKFLEVQQSCPHPGGTYTAGDGRLPHGYGAAIAIAIETAHVPKSGIGV